MSQKICRLCLSCPSVYFSLLDKENSEMLEALTSVKVYSNDMVSTITCLKCLLNMKLAFNIQQNILKIDKKWKKISVEVQPNAPELYTKQELAVMPRSEMLDLKETSCLICGINIKESMLNKHIENHLNHKQDCDLCDNSFDNIEEYKKHFVLKHKDCEYPDLKCNECDATFRYRSLYNVHLSRAHFKSIDSSTFLNDEIKSPQLQLAGTPFTCEICNKQFQHKRQLMSHTHKKAKCPICGAEISKNNFRKHVEIHSSDTQICELCGASLRNLQSLRGHLKHTHSSAVYTCEECGKVFRKRYSYLLHKRKHAGEKTHICETCGKAFFTLYYLNKHTRTAHLKLRPFICEYCKKAFSSKFAMRTHVRQHTNETPYKCEVCGDGFRQNVSLRAHRKTKHNIVEAKTCACSVCGKEFSSDQGMISHMRLH